MQTKKHYWQLFGMLSILMLVSVYLFHFLSNNQLDSVSYVDGARALFNWQYSGLLIRINKVFSLVLPGFAEKYLGIAASTVFIFQNILFYYGCGFFLYKIILLLSGLHKQALFGTFIFFTTQIVAIFSISVLTDVAGWFMAFLIMYVACLQHENKLSNITRYLWLGILCGAGFCFKENAIIGAIFCCCYILFLPQILFIKKTQAWILFFAGLVIIPVASYLFTQFAFKYSSLNHYAGEALFSKRSYFYGKGGVKQLYTILYTHWFFVAVGLWFCFRNTVSFKIKAFVATGILGLLVLPIGWAVQIDRVLFSVAPALVIVASFAYKNVRFGNWVLVLCSGVIGLVVPYCIYKHSIGNLIFISSVAFCIIVLSAGVLPKKYLTKLQF